ncbi:MAG: beta-ketoacyl synthase N-terminal-like domain-containing protein [Thermomicrobiales bacterium]
MSRRAVVTGLGAVTPIGIGVEAYWAAARAGTNGIKPISRFDPSKYATQLAGEVDGFNARDYIDQRLIVQTDRWTWMDLATTKMALEDSGFDPKTEDPYKMSVVTASSSGGNEFGQKEIQSLWGKGPIFVGAYQSIAWFYAASSGQIAIRHGLKGASGVICAEQSGGLTALWQARKNIGRGIEVVVAGGGEAPIGPYALTCQLQNGRLSATNDPATAYQPFGVDASGYVPGEGSAMLLVEDLEHARARGVGKFYGEIAGHGATHDGYHWADLAPDGRQYARAMSLALQSAGIGPEDVDVIFADGLGTPDGDQLEAQAIHAVFGDRAGKVPVTVPKTMVGRLYAGGAALDTLTALLAMRDGVIPPTINVAQPASGLDLNLVTAAQPAQISTALIAARGFGGFNSALVVRRFDGE